MSKKIKKQSKLVKLLKLSNVHVSLHLADGAQQYGTVMNCNVLVKEMKYKYLIIILLYLITFHLTNHCVLSRVFKAMTDKAAPSNLMGYLFAKDVMKQSIQLELTEPWRYTNSELTDSLINLQDQCSALLVSFLLSTDQDTLIDEDSDLREDFHHCQIYLFMQEQSRSLDYYNIHVSVSSVSLLLHYIFMCQLCHVFDHDYNLRDVLNLESEQLKWYSWVSYTDLFVLPISDHILVTNVEGFNRHIKH